MTEAEWLECMDPLAMQKFTWPLYSHRKQRLFGVACCRQRETLIRTRSCWRALVIAERMADGLPLQEDLAALRVQTHEDGFQWIDCHKPEREPNFAYGMAHAALHCLQEPSDGSHPPDVGFPHSFAELMGASPAAARAMAHFLRRSDAHKVSDDDYQRALADQVPLIRDIFANPFRPVAFDPAWRTSAAVALASQMYESREFGPMPILADALQEAGCDHANILAHCRGPGPHVRGCWVVDLVLGKS